jgi:hypothetical protein
MVEYKFFEIRVDNKRKGFTGLTKKPTADCYAEATAQINEFAKVGWRVHPLSSWAFHDIRLIGHMLFERDVPVQHQP